MLLSILFSGGLCKKLVIKISVFMFKSVLLCLFILILSGCSSLRSVDASAPIHKDNICKIFDEKPEWRHHLSAVRDDHGVPQHIVMAIMHQESRFVHNARPLSAEQNVFFGNSYASSAYGFSQALDETWGDFVGSVGDSSIRRDSFKDSSKFIGWYVEGTHGSLRLSKWDAEVQYLAYHEGRGGYTKKTYMKKSWLRKVAKKVSTRADLYYKQFKECPTQSESGSFASMFL
jgi:hypothetical protein